MGPKDPRRQSTVSLPCETWRQSTASLPYDTERPSIASLPDHTVRLSAASLTYDIERPSTESLPYGIVPVAPPIVDVVQPKVGHLPPVTLTGKMHQTQPPRPRVRSSDRKPLTKRHTVHDVTSVDENGRESPETAFQAVNSVKAIDFRSDFKPYGVAPAAPHSLTPASKNSVAFRHMEVTADDYTAKWFPASSSAPYKRVTLPESDSEFKTVVQNMDQMGGKMFKDKVKMICRIENHGLYKTYSSCREHLERVNDRGTVNERILWHGTSEDVLTNIYRGGFNRSYCGKNATAYGDGVYFATSFDYSASPTYSPPDKKGQKYIFQCRVLTGQFTQGTPGLIEPPMRTKEFRFDSAVNDTLAPTMFVVFKDMQVYPEYVITLKL